MFLEAKVIFMTSIALQTETHAALRRLYPALPQLRSTFAGAAYAGADNTFDPALTKFTDFLEGSGGKIITVLSLAAGLIGLASGRFSLGQIAVSRWRRYRCRDRRSHRHLCCHGRHLNDCDSSKEGGTMADRYLDTTKRLDDPELIGFVDDRRVCLA